MSTLNVSNINESGGVEAIVTAGVLDSGSLPAGSILQVVSVNKSDVATTTSSSFVDVAGLSVSITPSSTSSKILVMANISLNGPNSGRADCRVLRDATPIGVGDSSGVLGIAAIEDDMVFSTSLNYLDSPATTSSVTYKAQFSSGGTAYVNRRATSTSPITFSSITVMEVAG